MSNMLLHSIAGIGTHFVPSNRIPTLLARLAELESDDLELINQCIEEFVGDVPVDMFRNWSLGGQTMDAINR